MLLKFKRLFKRIREFKMLKQKQCILSFASTKNGILSENIGEKVALYGENMIEKNVKIGDYTAISPGNKIFSGEIGRFCSIGHECIIGPHDHPLNYNLTHAIIYHKPYKFFKDNNKNFIERSQKVAPIIEDNVWMGARCIVLRGCKIGEGSVIAANSVVTKDVEPYSIVGGIPAKHIRYREITNNTEKTSLKNLSTEMILNKIKNRELL